MTVLTDDEQVAPAATWTRRRFLGWVSACAVVSVLLRLRFVFTPITTDEGGFIAIARAWSHGKSLYADVWVDRPQGLLVLFRVWDFVSFGNAQSVRLMAILFGVVAVFAAAVIARCMTTPVAGVIAALFVAVLSSAPVLEGFLANGELLSGAPSLACLALGCMVITDRLSTRWMFVAGLAAGIAMSIKQSGYDGLLALGAWLGLALVLEWRSRRLTGRWLAALVAGLLSIWAALALHGAITGWSNWLYAVGGYRFEGRSALEGADWPRFWLTLRDARAVLYPALIIAAVCGIVALASRRAGEMRPRHAVLPLWLLAGVAAFATGGQFFHHYWVTLTFPIAVTTAVLIATLRRAATRNVVVVLVLILPLVSTMRFVFLPRSEVPVRVDGHLGSIREEMVGAWFLANAGPGETLYALCASASVYAHAEEDPPYPYLWLDNVNKARHAQDRLHEMFSSTALRPTYVALFQPVALCDPTDATQQALDQHYTRLTQVEGVTILVRNDRP